ncbi:MAG: 16S rRNA (guanine(527)-N(7))-methyltransferase RsmG [Deltaproteobacteria bacterium]|nr:16S rRNA (guanine(527)-N(7))-methyltransferase RsmG [Deltaproteobacteria bacterium]
MLESANIQLNSDQLGQLWRYHSLLRMRNQDRDLTRIVGFENMVIKHYIDSMIVGDLITLPSPLLDLGTGAGFPGIPLKIRYPDLQIVLAESRPRRVVFLKDVCKELGLKKIEVFEHKIVSRSFGRPVAAVITRAVEEMDKTILRTSACVTGGSQLIFMKGPNVEPEIQSAMTRFADKFSLIVNKSYRLPHTSHQRRLVVLERID